MGIDIAELYREELAALNYSVDLFGIPDDVFRECGASYLATVIHRDAASVVALKLEKGEAVPPELIYISRATEEFERLCQAAPHVPRDALSSLSMAYGAFLLATRNGEDMSGLESAGGSEISSLGALMSIAMVRGMAMGYSGLSGGVLKLVQAEMARKQMLSDAASKRHAENRDMKNEVFQWLDLNMSSFKSMDEAAEAIAGKVQPVKFRTARDWVGQWKKLRSPSTP